MNQEQESPASAVAPTLQDAVSRLQRFWESHSCVRLPPCDFPVPFATLHPDAFFRILGSEPWRVTYVQPVRRPLDGRYGEHPFRLCKHHQLEVVLKPPPGDLRRIYLESLTALGYDLLVHDVRFAEWIWEPRSLGARGWGWHALIDGLGVTRLTVLQRLADRDLEPASVEISYGLERLLLPLQGATSVFDVDWSPGGIDYGRLRRRDEQETSRYVFETADVDTQRQRLEAGDREAQRCLEAGLAKPGYELAVRCLEPIDMLEARGAASARQRMLWLDRVRSRVIAAAGLHRSEASSPNLGLPERGPFEAVSSEDASLVVNRPDSRLVVPSVPAEPAVPDEPATPDEPARPDEPGTPDEPTVPAEPAVPDKPAVKAKPAKKPVKKPAKTSKSPSRRRTRAPRKKATRKPRKVSGPDVPEVDK